VDKDNAKGQYLLTGSANIRFSKMVKDSLAGRLGTVRLRQLAFAEIEGREPSFLDVAFRRGFEGRDFRGLGKRDILRLAFEGGYPEARELQLADRQDWFRTYLDDLLTKDVQDITEIRRVETLRKVATSLVAHSAQFLAINELSAKAELAKVTLQNYIAALKALYLFDAVPAWAKSDYELIGKREKLFATDSALVANLLCWNESSAYLDESQNGKLVETWVYNQLAAIAETGLDYSISHYRDSNKREIDFIVERSDGALLGIEVKSGSALGAEDFKHLKWFAKNLSKGEFTGIVLYSGEHTLRFGEGFYAVPLAALGA
jgi:predicted AAA+ superfamily ATPase